MSNTEQALHQAKRLLRNAESNPSKKHIKKVLENDLIGILEKSRIIMQHHDLVPKESLMYFFLENENSMPRYLYKKFKDFLENAK